MIKLSLPAPRTARAAAGSASLRSPPSTARQERSTWLRSLGPAAAWFGGVSVVRAAPLPRAPRQGNYLRKVYSMWTLAKANGYTHIMSVDDDIVLAPTAIASLLRSPPLRDLGGGGGVSGRR